MKPAPPVTSARMVTPSYSPVLTLSISVRSFYPRIGLLLLNLS